MSRTICMCLAALLALPAAAMAADIGDSDLQMVQVYYQPTLMPSVDEAVAVLNALHESYSDWRGGRPTSGFVTKAHVDIHTNIHYTDTNTQWVPSWGGIIGPGGSYSPYMGGSNQTSQSERDEGADISVAPVKIQAITLWSYPNLERDFKFGFDLQVDDGGGKFHMLSFRTATIDIAHRLADAFATLTAANDLRFTPSLGIRSAGDKQAEAFTRLGWTQNTGMAVASVLDESPAKAAGIAHDDIIFEAGGKPVSNAGDVSAAAAAFLGRQNTASLPLKLFRGGQTMEIAVPLSNPNLGIEKLLPLPPAPPPPVAAQPLHLGIAARPLTAAEAKSAKRTDGVMIAGVDPGSLAEQMAMRKGDILLKINAAPIADMEALRKAIAAGGEIQTVTVLRQGKAVELSGISKL